MSWMDRLRELLDERQRVYAERDEVEKKLTEINERIKQHRKKAEG